MIYSNIYKYKKTQLVFGITLAVMFALLFIQASPAKALTVADYDGIPSACPDKYPYNTKDCATFIKPINVNGYSDNDTSLSARTTPVSYGYIIPGKTITVSWSKSGTSPSSYLVKFGCGNSIDFANDSYTIGWTTNTSIQWNVPSWVSDYKYCKVWVYAKQNSSGSSNNPTLGVSNTRPFIVQKPETPALQVSCDASPNPGEIGDKITFTVYASGGSGAYTYSWSGDVSGTTQKVYKSFSTSGIKTAYVIVKDTDGKEQKTSCYVTIKEQAPTPQYGYVCNTATYQCTYIQNGAYSTLAECQSHCQAPAPTVTISANPSTIDYGQTSILTWSSTNAISCTASGAWSGGKNTYGSEVVNPNSTSSYIITCTNSSGVSASATTTVNVRYANPYVELNVYPSSIVKGQTATLSWSGSNLSTCTATSTWSGSAFSGYKNTSGYEPTSPDTTTTYTINCIGTNGGYVSDSVILTVTEPSIGTILTLNKIGRNLTMGERIYSKVVRVNTGDTVEFYLQINNVSNTVATNVTILDKLPSELSYVSGSTKINNAVWQDGIATTGINVGTMQPNEGKTITFQATIRTPSNLFAITNVAELRADNMNVITDSTTVTYSAVAGAATVNTGPGRTMVIILGSTSSITASIWYFLNKTQKGKNFWEKYQKNNIKKRINKIRVK